MTDLRKMQKLTDNQLIYRAYLTSPLWKSKRAEALAFYGCKCARCGEWGNDVHHKTYDRVGGNELMEDFEILCRECHETHHKLDKIAVRHKKKRGIARRAIFKALSKSNKKQLMERFKLSSSAELFCKITDGLDMHLVNYAVKMLGCDYVFSVNKIRKSKRTYKYGQARDGQNLKKFY